MPPSGQSHDPQAGRLLNLLIVRPGVAAVSQRGCRTGQLAEQLHRARHTVQQDHVARVAKHLVDEAVRFRLGRAEVFIAEKKFLDLFPAVPRMFSEKMKQLCLQPLLLVRCDAHVFCIALRAATGGMHVDRGVRKCVSFTCRTRREQRRSHTRRDPDRYRRHRRFDHLHRVVDGETRVHVPARTVDVQVDRLLRIDAFEVKQLCDYHVRHCIVDAGAEDDDAFLEQQAVNVVRAFPLAIVVNDHRNQVGLKHGVIF